MSVRFTYTFTPQDGAAPQTFPRFIRPEKVVAVVAGDGPVVILLEGGHIVPVDGKVEIVEAKLEAARAAVIGPEVVAAEDPTPTPKTIRDRDGEDPEGVEYFEQHDGPAEVYG